MDIKIEKNDFKRKNGARVDIVQRICNAILRRVTNDHEYGCELSGPYPEMYLTTSYGAEVLASSHYSEYTQVWTSEMRMAFQVLQQAGYYIYVYNDGTKFYVSKRPYRYQTKARREEFTLFID